MEDFSKNPVLDAFNKWTKWMKSMPFQQYIKRLHNMDEYLEE